MRGEEDDGAQAVEWTQRMQAWLEALCAAGYTLEEAAFAMKLPSEAIADRFAAAAAVGIAARASAVSKIRRYWLCVVCGTEFVTAAHLEAHRPACPGKRGVGGGEMVWTDERDARLRELWQKPIAVTEIAVELGVALPQQVHNRVGYLRKQGRWPAELDRERKRSREARGKVPAETTPVGAQPKGLHDNDASGHHPEAVRSPAISSARSRYALGQSLGHMLGDTGADMAGVGPASPVRPAAPRARRCFFEVRLDAGRLGRLLASLGMRVPLAGSYAVSINATPEEGGDDA